MGGICADGMREPNFSSKNEYDSSGDYFVDDDSDVQSFVSNRSLKHRERRVKSRKTPYPSQIPHLLPYAMSSEENLFKKRRTNSIIEAKTADRTSSSSNVLVEDSQKSEAILVSTDDDMKKQIKELMEPFLFKRVQRIVDQTVDELFMKVNSSDVISSGSRKSMHLNQKRDSIISSVASSAADTKHSRREFENIKRDRKNSKASVVITPPKLLLNEQLNNGSIDDISDVCDDRSIKQPSMPQIQVLGNFDDKPRGRRISCLKLNQVAISRDLELKSGEISPILADSLGKSAVQPDHIRGQLPRENFESDQKVIEVQRLCSTNSLNAKMSSRESTRNVLMKIQHDSSESTGSSSMSPSIK